MRITGGECRGRVITGPEGLEVRPTASKIRQAFFNILSNKVDGARFVDVCAGSGLMGFEALSRGAASLISIEESRRMVEAIRGNANRLGFEGVAEVIAGDARKALAVLSPGEADIIFADPPYKARLQEAILIVVSDGELLSAEGVFSIEHANDLRLPEETSSLVQYDRRKYGQTAVSFYRRK
ncbi:MAG TPA: 16S rRNA (guanine(966)-N(2))-methyltransferase RsmD [Candidatus Obscuribacterales bacterium]